MTCISQKSNGERDIELRVADMGKSQLPKEMHEQIAAITPLRRLGMPDDIAGVVLFLASSLSDYLNGEYIPVTGGSFMI